MTKLLPILILGLGIIVGLYLVSQQTHLFSKASTSPEPRNIKITNLSDNSFSLVWTTTQKVPGFITYGTSETLGMIAHDDRDNQGPSSRFTHHVTLKDLDPQATIFYNVNSGGKVFKLEGKPYAQKTALTLSQTPPLPKPIIGKILSYDGKPVDEAIVYISINDSQVLSGYTRDNGNWLITLNTARSQDLSNYFDLKIGDKMEIEANDQSGFTTKQSVNYQEGTNTPIELKLPIQTSTPMGQSNLQLVRDNFGKKGTNIPGDLNKDGIVNSFDLIKALIP